MSGVFSRSPTIGLPGSPMKSGLDPKLAALVTGAAFFTAVLVRGPPLLGFDLDPA
jgi:hypothetical protein